MFVNISFLQISIKEKTIDNMKGKQVKITILIIVKTRNIGNIVWEE